HGERRPCDQRPGQACVAPDPQPHVPAPDVLEERRDQLAPETLGQVGGERRDIGHTTDAVSAEEPGHRHRFRGRTGALGAVDASSMRRRREGLTRTTVMPYGTMTCSGRTRSAISPDVAPDKLIRTLIWSGVRRDRLPRSAWTWISTLSGRSDVMVRPAGRPSNSIGAARMRSDRSDVMTK